MNSIPAALVLSVAVWCFQSFAIATEEASQYFQIQVIDAQTRRGIPLVTLRTTNHISYVTDSQGTIAFFEPGLMAKPVFFYVESHGYQFTEDGFGIRGVTLNVQEGGKAVIEMERVNIAERLYRITGQGIYRDSFLTGASVPLDKPLLNGDVMGQDTVFATPYRDRIFWIWGDTNRPGYPLGNFQTSGAVSDLPENEGLNPELGIDLQYFTREDGFVRAMCPIVDDSSYLVWLDALMTISDEEGDEHLLAHYTILRSLGEPLEHGMVLFDDTTEVFKKQVVFDIEEPWRYPQGQAVPVEDEGIRYYLFPTPFPNVRVQADINMLQDPSQYEAFTCLKPGGCMEDADTPVMRDESGQLVWTWRKDTTPISQNEERILLDAGLIEAHETRFQLSDMETEAAIQLHRGSFHPNTYLDKWIMIGCEIYGRSFLGEIWFAEAPSATGPWRTAKRIVTHDHYSFYNPAHHPFFDQDEGRYVYFEGTYTEMFSGRKDATPRYEYNQIMYRLDLSDPCLR